MAVGSFLLFSMVCSPQHMYTNFIICIYMYPYNWLLVHIYNTRNIRKSFDGIGPGSLQIWYVSRCNHTDDALHT